MGESGCWWDSWRPSALHVHIIFNTRIFPAADILAHRLVFLTDPPGGKS